MQRTRAEIVSILRSRGEETVRGLAQALGLTPMSVRLHLSVLHREGLIDAREVHQQVGRPYFAYRLTDQAEELLPKAYSRLAARLLDVASAAGCAEILYTGILEDLARRSAGRLAGKSLDERLGELAEILSDEGFMAELERTEEGYVLRTCNCPYPSVARAHPGLCAAEASFIEGVVGPQVAVNRTDFRLEGHARCAYRLRLLTPDEIRAAS